MAAISGEMLILIFISFHHDGLYLNLSKYLTFSNMFILDTE